MSDPRVGFFLPAPPTANSLFTNVPGKGRVRTEKYRTWAITAGWMIRSQNVGPVPGPHWRLIIEAPISRRRDLDNILKPTLDLIVSMGLISDDRYVDQITLMRVNPKEWSDSPDDHIRVTITPLVG